MPNATDILWFKTQFHEPINRAVAGTPFDLDMIAAIACQETGIIWSRLRHLPAEKVLELCVGDTLDFPKRKAFPQNKDDLLAKPNGQAMFTIARDALVSMAAHVPGFNGAVSNANKFCRGFGLFQLDLQHFPGNSDYFLQRRYVNFSETLARCIEKLQEMRKGIGLGNKLQLTDAEKASVAIAYNIGSGRFRPEKGLKQGHFDGSKFYGEHFFDFMLLARTVSPLPVVSAIPALPPGTANLSQPTPVSATGTFFRVDTRINMLRVRRRPSLSGKIFERLPDGHVVRDVGSGVINGFREIETSLAGAHIRGFSSDEFLKKIDGPATVPVAMPAPLAAGGVVPAVFMPRRPGHVTRRTDPAGAHSLNEPGQPGRQGTTPDALRAELDAIINFLAVEKDAHLRYKPVGGRTFCNIYAHDFCHLAGVYLPRVWWSQRAVVAFAQGQVVEPRLADTIHEMLANALFRWLRDFGLDFGWRQTGTLTKLQAEVNGGAVGLIIARRLTEGAPGHVVVVAPESAEHQAKRDAAGLVTAPLQSQAGAINFRRDTGRPNWWLGQQFAEHAFWIHA